MTMTTATAAPARKKRSKKRPPAIYLACDICGRSQTVRGPEYFTRAAQVAWSKVHCEDGCRVAQ